MNSRGIPFPSFRFIQYKYVGDDILPKLDMLGYTASTWNRLGSNPIELIAFEAQGNGRDILSNLGYTQESWDCFINHYFFFSWSELADLGVQQYFEALDWEEDNWGSFVNAPDTIDMFWDELSEDQRNNATELCYFEQTWNGDNLMFWTTGPPTDSPTQAPALPATSEPTSKKMEPEGESAAAHGFGAWKTRALMTFATLACAAFVLVAP